jgi:hypothetical protein
MKPYDVFWAFDDEQTLRVSKTLRVLSPTLHPPGDRVLHLPAPHPTTQAERAVMHPGRHDLEWRYCHGAWLG